MKPPPPREKPLELAEVRARLQAARGPLYWRSLEELAATPEFHDLLHREFPRHATEWDDTVSRRRFLEVMAASLALAGLSGCTRQPTETIVPYVRQPEEIVPGKPLFYATAMTLSGVALPLLAESHMGRPIKLEGNPEHPASLGATDIYAQASILGLYDPDRSQTLLHLGEVRPWTSFLGSMRGPMAIQKTTGGAGLRILTETVSSPTLAWQIASLLKDFPNAKWHQYEPVNRDNAHKGAVAAFGQMVDAQYRFDNADVIVSLDADFLSSGYPGFVRYARDFAKRRKLEGGNTKMSRLYAVESTPTNTGAAADHRVAIRAFEVKDFAHALATALGIQSGTVPAKREKWISAIASDLQAHHGASLVIAGEGQPPVVHALAHAINESLGNVGHTVIYTDPLEASPVMQADSLRELVRDMEAGKVDLLVVLGGNPVFNSPVDIDFAKHLHKVGLRVHLGLYHDETAALCHWHVPETHYLESWGDARAYDGMVSIVQPLIAPLYDGKTSHEVLAALTDRPDRSAYEIVREYWKTQHTGADFELWWRRSLHDGWIAGTAFGERSVKHRLAGFEPLESSAPMGLELGFRPDPSVYDGRFAGNGWLQELPKPLTKLTWENAAFLSPKTAEAKGLKTGDVVELDFEGRRAQAPVFILPGQPEDSVCVHLGYGRHRAGRVGSNIGFNAYALRTSGSSWFGGNLRIEPAREHHELSVTHGHWNMEGRDLVRASTLPEYVENPHVAHERHEEPAPGLTLYPGHKYEGNAWGMAIDLNSCIGCNACVMACQSENNIPVVGREQVMRQREMHWIRIDRYFEGSLDDPQIYFQPVPCMQCENAPCEPVCPVGATVHSSEGLNDQVYNRCVGTRYCANNCPYKVRRFNFLLYQDFETPSLKLMRNPDVTVRSRGVMEKCTYCVQRINAARITAEKEDRPIQDGEVQTACQQACPAGAIIFGNINDKNSRVARLKQEARNYGLLAELNTRPRTTYLAAVRNPNPALAAAEKKA
ncbi:MAG TPA: TAT-variant-translocated molybdopterin oxidoreductase [Terriglobales bacterium]|nr:TAT-variant-translocated molybdopterin oxidoreductase [Terriglobales bacterium]